MMFRKLIVAIKATDIRTIEIQEVLFQIRDTVGAVLENQKILSENQELLHSRMRKINHQLEETMSQVDELRQAITDNAEASDAALDRVEAKLAELGEPDPDLTNDIATLRATTSQIKSIANPETPDPGAPDYVPGEAESQPVDPAELPTEDTTDSDAQTEQG